MWLSLPLHLPTAPAVCLPSCPLHTPPLPSRCHLCAAPPCRSLIAAAVLDQGWGYSFVVPGLLLMAGGVVLVLFLVVHPEDVGLHLPSEAAPGADTADDGEEASTLLQARQGGADAGEDSAGAGSVAHSDMKGISFWEAWSIPGVAPFAACLFFTKLVAYCLMYWLPFYIRHTSEPPAAPLALRGSRKCGAALSSKHGHSFSSGSISALKSRNFVRMPA